MQRCPLAEHEYRGADLSSEQQFSLFLVQQPDHLEAGQFAWYCSRQLLSMNLRGKGDVVSDPQVLGTKTIPMNVGRASKFVHDTSSSSALCGGTVTWHDATKDVIEPGCHGGFFPWD